MKGQSELSIEFSTWLQKVAHTWLATKALLLQGAFLMQNHMPVGARLASTSLAVGGILQYVFSFFMVMGGVFAGLHVLVGGLLTFGLGFLGMLASTQLTNRRIISRTTGIGWGVAVLAFNCAIMFASLRDPDDDIVFTFTLSATFGALSFCAIVPLLLSSTSRWFALTNEQADSRGGTEN